MKVLCIDAKTRVIPLPDYIKEGSTYEVIECSCCDGYNIIQYDKVFAKDRFIPVSGIDETELIKQREETYA